MFFQWQCKVNVIFKPIAKVLIYNEVANARAEGMSVVLHNTLANDKAVCISNEQPIISNNFPNVISMD